MSSGRLRDVCIADAVRTTVGEYGGAPASVRPDDLAARVVRCLVDRSPDLDPAAIDDVDFGNADGAGEENRNVDPELVKPHGGAIDIGHPLGASGARIAGAVAHQSAAAGSGVALSRCASGRAKGRRWSWNAETVGRDIPGRTLSGRPEWYTSLRSPTRREELPNPRVAVLQAEPAPCGMKGK